MKKIIFLISIIGLFSFSMPPVIQDDAKNDWAMEVAKPVVAPAFSAPFIKESKTVKKAMNDYMVVYQTPETVCRSEGGYSGVTIAQGETNMVAITRAWEIEFNTTTGTYFVIIQIPAYTHQFGIYNRNNWACGSTVTGTWSRPYGW